MRTLGMALLGAACTLAAPLAAQQQRKTFDDPRVPVRNMLFQDFDDGSILVTDASGQYWFDSPEDYLSSRYFQDNGLHCGSDQLLHPFARGTTSDCSNANTNPTAEYEPSGGTLYEIPVVFHVLTRNNGTGAVSDALINAQIDVLNEDFRAMAGTNGAGGTDTRIQFTLAGITRSRSNSWYNDSGTYYNSLAWDTTRYLNIYTNAAGGNLGYAYVPSGGGVVGNTWDRVVLYWPTVGRPAPYGAPYNLGRTATHEVGHYLGLYHTFQGGCTSTSGCNQNGDLICDTNPESQPNYSPCSRSTCGSPDPTNNYMDYSDDVCMNAFSSEQARRMRCTLENFRVDLAGGNTGGNPPGATSSPSPSDGADSVSTSVDLSWGAGSGATSYDVYFGTDSTPDAGELQGNQTGTSFDPGTLAEGTTYFWRVDSVNADGTTTGSVWSFTTETTGPSNITLSSRRRGRRAILSWSGASGQVVEIYRNGSLLTTTNNDGSYTDSFARGTSGTFTYQVCEPGGACSNTSSVTF